VYSKLLVLFKKNIYKYYLFFNDYICNHIRNVVIKKIYKYFLNKMSDLVCTEINASDFTYERLHAIFTHEPLHAIFTYERLQAFIFCLAKLHVAMQGRTQRVFWVGPRLP